MKLGSHAVMYLGEHSRQNEKQEERKTGRTPRADFILLLGFLQAQDCQFARGRRAAYNYGTE